MDWPLTFTTQPSTSKLSDNPGLTNEKACLAFPYRHPCKHNLQSKKVINVIQLFLRLKRELRCLGHTAFGC